MTPEDICNQVANQLGIRDEPTLAWEGLCVAYRSLQEEMPASPVARLVFDGACVRQLSNYVALDKLGPPTDDHRGGRRRTNVMVIVGLPRTGTTLLHNLLAAEPGTAFLSHLDLQNSWWMLGRQSREEAASDVARRLDLIDALEPAIRDIHPVQLEWPDECTLLFEDCFASYQWPATYGLPAYFDWLQSLDMAPYYRWYGRAVDVLAGWGGNDACRLVLKSPFHLLHLDALRQIFPTAVFVNTVRRADEVVGSWLQLVDTTHRAMFDGRALPVALRDRWVNLLACMADRSRSLAGNEDCHVVRFEDLARNPIRVLDHLMTAQGRSMTAAHRGVAEAWMSHPEAQRRRPAGSRLSLDLDTHTWTGAFDAYDRFFGLS